MTLKKTLSLILAAVLIINLAGVAFRLINPLVFWFVVIVAAITAYKVLPKLNG